MTAITVEDLDNAKLDVDHIAEVANSTADTAISRLGTEHMTVTGALDRLASINFVGPWATATAYAVKDAFSFAGQIYVTLVAHTSTTVAADLASGNIALYQGVATTSTDSFFSPADFTPGSSTTLTLSRDPGTKENITVHYGGSYLDPRFFELSGTTLTFSPAIPSYVTEVFVQIGRLQSAVTPSSRSVGDNELAWGQTLSRAVDTIAAMKALNSAVYKRAFAMGYYEALGFGGGTFLVDETDTTSPDDGGFVIVGDDGARWKRQNRFGVTIFDFGAKGIGAAFDDSPAIQACINAIDPFGEVIVPEAPSYFNLMSTVTFPATSGSDSGIFVRGNGIGSVLRPGAAMTTMFDCPGKNINIERLFFFNQSSFATVAIRQENDPLDAALSGRYSKCYIIGFTEGMRCAGQNFTFDQMWMQDNTKHFRFTNDGRNTTWYEPYCLGGATGFTWEKTTHQPEGVAIIGGKTLVTGGSGAGLDIAAGLDITLLAHVIDQTGLGSPGIYLHPTGGNAVAKIRVIGGWIAGGENSYAIFGSGNLADISVTGNASIMSNNSLNLTAGIALNGANGVKLIDVNFGVVGGDDIDLVSCSNVTRLGCTSSQGSSSNAVANYIDQNLQSAGHIRGQTIGFNTEGISPDWTYGAGDPNGIINKPKGSLRSRITDGGVGSTLYVCNGGTSWSAVS